MADYEPLDLTPYCNMGRSVCNSPDEPTSGEQLLRGLPFSIAEEPEAQFVGLGTAEPFSAGPLTVPVGKSVRNVLFAHALVTSNLHEGERPGRTVGTYRFVFDDGGAIEVPIRERFEIGVVPVAWGELPFLAVPDRQDELMDRFTGPWDQTGFRETEARQAWPRDYYLWAWRNPRPEAILREIEIIHGEGEKGGRGEGERTGGEDPYERIFAPSFIIAGITLGFVDEDPFGRAAALPVKITLPRSVDAAEPFGLEVAVDRGVATYPYALPEQALDAFLQDTHSGFGETLNASNSPAYTQVAAAPSATLTVSRGEEELGSARWVELEEKRTVDTERVRFEIVETGRNWVHTTVLDDDTGKPVPCRVHFRSPHGVPYAPHGHHPHVNSNMGTWHIDIGGDVRLGQISYAYIDGKCQGWLPRGDVIVDVARGYEYEPQRARVEIRPGQRELELRIKRHHNLNRERYFSGDTHVHFLSTQGALTEAAAEDLDVVNLLLSQWGHLFTNSEEFTGRPAIARDGETIVYASQENRQHLLGHLTLLGLNEPVMPWCSDGPGEAEMGGNLEVTMSHWADACHAQGGTVIIPHIPNPNGEPAALIATGRADAVEFLIHNPFFHLEYYRYLNGGYRLPLVGGTDKMDSGVPVGLYRTYAYIPPDEPFGYDNWCKAVRSGNTFLSGGPLLRFTVDGKPIGSTLQLKPGGGTVDVEAIATSIFPIHTLEIVKGLMDDERRTTDGPGLLQHSVVASAVDDKGVKELRVRATVRVDGPTWLCARCAGPGYAAIPHHDSWHRGIMAHTSPVYISCGAGYDVFSPQTMEYMLTLLDGSLQHIGGQARQWKPGTVTHHHGEHDHQAFLERPFNEAIAAVHRKLHEHGIPH